MKEIGLSNFVKEVTENKRDLFFVSSVNYERRSLEWLKIVKKIIFQNKVHKLLHLYRLSIENPQTISILNEKIHSQEIEYNEQINIIRKRIDSDKVNIKLSDSTKPLFLGNLPDVNKMITDLQKNSNLEQPFLIVFDITALPRRVILLVMETFTRLIEEKKVNALYILYTWPLRYPVAGRSTNTGSFRVENSKVPLSEFLDDVNEIHGIMTAGRDGSIGRLFLESMQPRTKVDFFFYVKKDDYLYALNNMLNNSNVFSYIDKNSSTTVNYYLSISRGYETIMNKVKSILGEWNASKIGGMSRALLIAPLGPKPMMITAFIGARYADLFFKKNSLNYKSGIAHVTSLQQNDLYSIGMKETSCYRIKIEDLLGE